MSLGAQDNAQASQSGDEATAAEEAKAAQSAAAKPFFKVTGGNPSDEEVGILAAVLATAEGNALAAGEHPSGPRNDWGAYEDKHRSPFGYNPNSFSNVRRF